MKCISQRPQPRTSTGRRRLSAASPRDRWADNW